MKEIKKDLAFGFVIYHPTAEFLRRIEILSMRSCQIYLFDNSPEEPLVRRSVRGLNNVTYITAGKNVGLGFALATICAGAYYEQFSLLQFFDQDTNFDLETLGYIESFAKLHEKTYTGDYLAVVFTSKRAPLEREHEVTPVDLAISSGSLFFLSNLKRVGWHNETYFVDGVDYEICLKAKINSLKIGVCCNTPGFDHVSEQPDKYVNIFGRNLPIRRYSTARVKDSMHAYFRLILTSVRFRQLRYAGIFVRSLHIYVLGQLLSRITLK